MGDIIDFKTRTVESHDAPPPLPSVGIPIACVCTSMNYELRNGGAVVCARCHCQVNVEWKWLETEDGK